MVLTIDIGNTSAKYALYEGKQQLHFERLQGTWEEALSCIERTIGKPERALISNVAGNQSGLEAALAQHDIGAEWISWQSEGIERFFRNIPEGLGADRVAAIIGARALDPESDILLVDAGTCLTFDVVAACGEYRGGSISPGIGIRLKAMHDYTAALPMLQPEGDAPVVGHDIYTAMRGACVNGVRWEIEGYVRHLLHNGYPHLRTYYTGGNSLQLADDVEAVVTHSPSLIFEGLLAMYGA